MLTFFRRASKSKIGTWTMAIIGFGILAGFAAADLSNFGSGNISFGGDSSALASVGGQQITEREMSEAMQRRLQQVRQERPDADYASIMGDFDAILSELMESRTLLAFAHKFHFPLSKRLVDAEISQIPQTRGLNGQFDERAYQGFLAQQRLTDAQVREVLAGGLLQRFVLTPIAANARVSVGMARPFASMLLEAREGEAAAIPVSAFRAGLQPSEADIQAFYNANRARYTVPEQRSLRIARIGDEQVASVTASDQEVAAYYNAHKAEYAAKEARTISQAVVQDQATAAAIAQRAKAGSTLAAAAAPAGANAAVTSLSNQSREAYASVAGGKMAAAAFAAPSGAVVGPVQTDFGWAVAKVDSIKSEGGKSLEQARTEIAPKLTAEKRKAALDDLIARVQDAVDEGSNFTEAASQAKLSVSTTPLIFANGTSRAQPGFKLPLELALAVKTGFEVAPNDPPEIVDLSGGEGSAMVSPGQVVAAAPAPLAEVRAQVAQAWIDSKALERARAASSQIAAKVARGMPLAQAVKESGAPLPPVQPLALRRIQLADAQGQIPAAYRALFTLPQGKSQMVADPQGRGFVVVKVNKITPGNAAAQPMLITRMQSELQQGASEEYARQFLAAIRAELGAKRNEAAIQRARQQLSSNGG